MLFFQFCLDVRDTIVSCFSILLVGGDTNGRILKQTWSGVQRERYFAS